MVKLEVDDNINVMKLIKQINSQKNLNIYMLEDKKTAIIRRRKI